MINNFSLYLALRYLRPKRTFVSVITVISVLGVTFGVAALVVVISVMRGFHGQIHELALSFEAHIRAADTFGTAMEPIEWHEGSHWWDAAAGVRTRNIVAWRGWRCNHFAMLNVPRPSLL